MEPIEASIVNRPTSFTHTDTTTCQCPSCRSRKMDQTGTPKLSDVLNERWKEPDWLCPLCNTRNVSSRAKCRSCGGQWSPNYRIDGLSHAENRSGTGETEDLAGVLGEVLARREAQDVQSGGGPAHDDTYGPCGWAERIKKAYRIAFQERRHPCTQFDHQKYEQNLIDVAAIAVAAIQSSRRMCLPEADMMAYDSVINELRDFAEWIRREKRNRRTILKALDARVAYLQGMDRQKEERESECQSQRSVLGYTFNVP